MEASRPHVLVVNSDPVVLELLRDTLEGAGYAVTTERYTPWTFDQIAARQPTLLLVDLAPDEAAGWDLLERLRVETSTRHIPLIITSTQRRLLDHAAADHDLYGGQLFLTKPFDADDLLRQAQALLAAM